jgi:2-(1,2-epoxy-1,2-dihydrophenyl)acetyl-CoA isomerase
MQLEFIKFEIKNGIATIELNRPEKFHSIIRQMALELQQALDFCNRENEIRSVIFTASGKAFCAGQDLSEAIDENGIEISDIVEEHYNPIILKLRNLTKPVVCGVNGVAAGAGANIALACDIVVAAESASFIQAFSKIGLVPDSGGTFLLPRLVGFQRATALMLLGDKVSAHQAKEMGMIFNVVKDEELTTELIRIATQLANMPTKAFEFTKILLNESMHNSLEKQLTLEGEYQQKATETNDYKEGVTAFLEKRKPVFKGN